MRADIGHLPRAVRKDYTTDRGGDTTRAVPLAARGRSVFVMLLQKSKSYRCRQHEDALQRVFLCDPRQNRRPEA